MTYTAIPITTDKETYYVIVSDEEIKSIDKDFWIISDYNHIRKCKEVENDKYLIIGDNNGVLISACKKVIAQSSPIHEGILLFDMPDEAKMVWNNCNITEPSYCDSFVSGFNKAKEKYKWTDEDIKKAFKAGASSMVSSKAVISTEKDFLQYLNQPKQYKVELEMEEPIVKYSFSHLQPKITNNKVIIKSWKYILE